MRKKILSLLFISLFANSIVAQITSLPSSSAFQSTKYNDASVNESSGRVSTSIPVCNYQVGKLQVPVSLFYIGNGVKVAQQSSWVGTNWNLNAGGVVTRIVNGYPDEKATARYFLEDLGDPALLDSQNYILQANDTRDYRADIFSFSFAGYSGSFYLDKSNFNNPTVRLTNNNSELKIEFVGGFTNSNTNTILITTPEGIKYYFGGVNASENSSTLIKHKKKGTNWGTNNNEVLEPVSPLATTAFYLYKIENNYNDQILIDYLDDGAKNFILFEQQEESIATSTLNGNCEEYLGDYLNVVRNAVFHGTIHNSKKISRIYSLNSNIEVKFNSEQLLLPSDGKLPTPQYNDRILKSIHVYNNLISQNVKNIILDHLIPTATSALKHRFFLEKVSINNSNLSADPKCEVYKMEYNNPEALPSRFSYNVDLMGYFNGESNASYIDHDYYSAYQSAGDLTKRDPNFEFTTKGALKKIYYPSGGHTAFEYERPYGKANTVKNLYLHVYKKLVQEAVPHQSPPVFESVLNSSYNVGTDTYIVEENHPFDTTEDITAEGPLEVGFPPVTIYKDCFLGGVITINNKTLSTVNVKLNVNDLTTNTSTYHLIGASASASNSSSPNISLKKDHKYTFTLSFVNTPNDGAFVNISNYVFVDAYLDFDANEYLPASGIRIKKVTEFSGSEQTNTKRYYYKKVKDIGKSIDDSGVVIFEPELETSWNGYTCASETYNAVTLIANPFANIFGSSDNQIEYKYVTTSFGGDAFELGGVEKHFRVEKNDKIAFFYKHPDTPARFIPEEEEYGSCTTNNKNQFNGTLLREVIFEKKGTNLFVKEDKEFVYDPNPTIDHEIQNFVLSTTYQGEINPFDNPFPSIGKYSTFSYRYNLKEIKSKTYTTPVLLGSNPLLPDFISTKTSFEYTTLRGLPSKVSTNDSKGKTLTKRFYYPVTSDVSLLSANTSPNFTLSTTDAGHYSDLEIQNNISSPIQVETYSKDNSGIEKLLTTKRSLFTKISGKILPYTEQVAKSNNPLTSNAFFSGYDADANLVEVTQENIKKSTIYGYKNQTVIAELPNVAYASIPSSTITMLQTASNSVVDQASMNAFEVQLNSLRTLFPDAQITTYVYNPSGQLDSVTDARGRKMTYVYDDCKRLKMTKDNEGNIIEEYQYNLLNN